MFEFFGQLLAAIFGILTSNPKFNSKYKIWISIAAGVSFFVIFKTLSYFDNNHNKTGSIYIELALSFAITLLGF